MANVKDKIQCSIRLHRDQYEQAKEKATELGISYQRLAEILFVQFIRGDKDIMKVVKRFTNKRNTRLKKYEFDEIERDELARIIEKEYSPLKFLGEEEEAVDENKK